MALRALDSTLRASLLRKEPFTYAHLIKFERPETVEGIFDERSQKYAYLTDASRDILWNDGSTNISGGANGGQVYVANKVFAISDITEGVEAKAFNMNLRLSAVPLNTSVRTDITTTSDDIETDTDLVAAGFAEGDKIRLTGGAHTNNGDYFRIESFSNNNQTMTVFNLGDALTANSSPVVQTIEIASDEINALFADKSSGTYANYINREVFIYKAHIDERDGAIIGSPYLIFKGIISSSKVNEDPEKGSTIDWGLTSHWGDFQFINGRITSDAEHRAIGTNGEVDFAALKDPAYAEDLGFLHSEQALNIMATYQTKEIQYKLKKKKKWYGGSKQKLRKIEVEVDRDVDLRFNLNAKRLPVVYGVRKIDSFPIFADTLNNDASTVYVAYALCEGEVAGIYDIYFDDEPSICVDKADFDVRNASLQTDENAIDVVCRGRMDRGDVLADVPVVTSTTTDYGQYIDSVARQAERAAYAAAMAGHEVYLDDSTFDAETPTDSGTTATSAGLIHERGHTATTPIDVRLTFHNGSSSQTANNMLVNQARQNNFKIQNDYYTNRLDYWGPNHRLLDTAYVVGKFTIGEGETEIPSMDYVVRGKLIQCYNYDFAYRLDSRQDQGTPPKIGDTVTVKRTSNDSIIGSTNTLGFNNTVVDIFTFKDETNTDVTMVRLESDPSLGTVTEFYLDGYNASNHYYLVTYDRAISTGSVPSALEATISSSAATDGGDATQGMSITYSATGEFNEAMGTASSPGVSKLVGFYYGGSPPAADSDSVKAQKLRASYLATKSSSSTTVTNIGGDVDSDFSSFFNRIVSKDAIKLRDDAEAITDTTGLVGSEIELVYTNSSTGAQVVQTKIIDAYDDSNHIARIRGTWRSDYIPSGSGYTYTIREKGDRRVSTNPAIQLLDYMQNERYGRGLKESDIDLDTFFTSARLCDTRSDIYVQMPIAASVSVDDVIRYPATGDLLFQGTVSSVTDFNSLSLKEVRLTDCIGKLANKWHDWKSYDLNALVWDNGNVVVVPSAGTVAQPSSVATVTVRNTTTSTNINLNTADTSFEGDPIVRKYNSSFKSYGMGYTLYDADEVKYWKYLGWDSQNQRHVTRHQTNMVVDTTQSVFDNVNGMLAQFNGQLRYTLGKYNLDVKSTAGTFETVSVDGTGIPMRTFDQDDIIGSITVADGGVKGSFNTLSVEIDDPQNKFEERNVSFFNSDYLKEDRNIPRKGDFSTPNVTNYYNARINAKQYLEESRFGLDANFTLGPEGILLLPGELIKLTYPRFGWSDKYFRITSLKLKKDCLVDVSVTEHDDNAYIISGLDKPLQVQAEPTATNTPRPTAPGDSDFTATTDLIGVVTLTWINTAQYNPATFDIEVERADNLAFNSNVVSLGLIKSGTAGGTGTYTDQLPAITNQTKYYRIRYRQNLGNIFKYSDWTTTRTGTATALSNQDGTSVAIVYAYQRSSTALTSDPGGVTVDLTGADAGTITTPAGNTLSNGWTKAIPAGTDPLYIVAATASGTGDTDTIAASEWSDPVILAQDGTTSKVVSLSASTQVVSYDAAGANPSTASITLTADSQNFTDAYFRFTGGGSAFTDETSFTDGTSANQDTATFTVPSSYSSTPYTFTVEVQEGNSGPTVASDIITIASVRPGDDGDPGEDALTVILTNETHALPQPKGGDIDHTGSGTTIRVFEGTTELDYDNSGSTAGHWDVSASGSGITAGNITESGNTAVVQDHTGMTGSTATVTYTITGQRLNGDSLGSIQKIQTLNVATGGSSAASSTNLWRAENGKSWASFDNITTNDVFLSNGGGTSTIAIDTSEYYTEHSHRSLKFTNNSDSNADFVYMADSAPWANGGSNHFVFLPANRRFLASAWINSNSSSITVAPLLLHHDGSSTTGPAVTGESVSSVNTWEQLWWEIDATVSGQNTRTDWQLALRYDNKSGTEEVYADALMLLDVTDTPEYTTSNPPTVNFISPTYAGLPGLNSASVFIYKRTSSSTMGVSDKPSGDTTYTFSNGAISFTTANSWSATAPASGSKYLWRRQATAAATTATDAITDDEWSEGELLGVDGDDGAAGAAGAAGADGYTVVAKPESFAFLADTEGTVPSVTAFSLAFSVFKGTQELTYDPGTGNPATYGSNTFRYAASPNAPTGVNVDITVEADGDITIDSSGSNNDLLTSAADTGRIEVTIVDNGTGNPIAAKEVSLTKLKAAARDGAIFTFEESSTSQIDATDAAAWAGTLTTDAARAVAEAVTDAAADGFIRPNDRITVTDNSANVAGTRIFNANATSNHTSVNIGDFSSLVVETFDGSVIVDGTLSADKVTSNFAFTNNLTVQSSFTLNSSGVIRTTGADYDNATNGFFLGYDSTDYKFRIGNNSGNRMTWDGTDLDIIGNVTIGGASGTELTEDNTLNENNPTPNNILSNAELRNYPVYTATSGRTDITGRVGTVRADKHYLGSWSTAYTDLEISTNYSTDWTLESDLDINTLYIKDGGTQTNYLYYVFGLIPVEPGEIIEGSIYTGAHRCETYTYISFYDSSLASISGGAAQAYPDGQYNNSLESGGKTLAGYRRNGQFRTAPANSKYAALVVRKGAKTSGSDSYAFLTMPYFGRADSINQNPAPWGAGQALPTVDDAGRALAESRFGNSILTPRTLADDLSTNPNLSKVGYADDGRVRPANILAGYGGSDQETIRFKDDDASTGVLVVAKTADLSVGAMWPAFPVNHEKIYRVFIRYRVDQTVDNNFYVHYHETTSELPAGITHIAHNGVGETGVGTGTRQLYNTVVVSSTDSQMVVGADAAHEGITATSAGAYQEALIQLTDIDPDAKWVGVSVLNYWSGTHASGSVNDVDLEIDTLVIYELDPADSRTFVNIIPDGYSDFDTHGNHSGFVSNDFWSNSLSTVVSTDLSVQNIDTAFTGDYYLQVAAPGGTSGAGFYSGQEETSSNGQTYHMSIPTNRKWLVSWRQKLGTATEASAWNCRIITIDAPGGTNDTHSPTVLKTQDLTSNWQQYVGIFDLTGNPDPFARLRFYNTAFTSADSGTIHFDAIQMSDITGFPNIDAYNYPEEFTAGIPLISYGNNVAGAPNESIITNFDEATALGFNPSFSDWPSTNPTGYSGWESGGATKTTSNPSPLTGAHCVGFTTNGTDNYGIVRRAGGTSPTVSMEWDGDSVIIGSFDAYVESGASGTGAGLLVRFWKQTTSPQNYADKFATIDPSVTGKWQRVYFKLSENDRSNSSTTLNAGNFVDLTIYVMGAWNGYSNTRFNGSIYFDNLRFAVLDPSVENERTTWTQVKGNGGSTLPADNATNNGSTIDSNGDVNATIEMTSTGKIFVGTSQTGSRIQIDGSTNRIEIYDGSGSTPRVRLGNLP